MNSSARTRIHMFAANCGLFYLIFLFVGWAWIAGFLPPHSPGAGPEEIASLFRNDATRIRIGMVVTMYAAFIFLPFGGLLSYYLGRVEGGPGVLCFTSLLGAAGNMVLTFYPPVWWLTAAYRPDRSPDLIFLFNDWAWLAFVGGVSLWDAMPFSIALAAFCDKSPNPTFPRWFGYFNIMVMFLILPDQLLFFFQSGPFAWNGMFGMWLPLVAFGGWFVVTALVLRKAVRRDKGA